MSTTIFSSGLSTMLQGAVIESLTQVPGAGSAVNLLQENFKFTAAEIANNFQNSYGYALAAINNGLTTKENQRKFWQTLTKTKVETEFAQRLEQDYLQPFAQQHKLAEDHLAEFRPNAVTQCKQMAKLTLFQADDVPFSEQELASFVTASKTGSMTNLVLDLVQKNHSLDENMIALLRFKELLGNALLFFLHEQLRKEDRFKDTLAALQRADLLEDTREIKDKMQSIGAKLQELAANNQFGEESAQLNQKLARLQQVETIAQTHYAQFHDFSYQFADWSQLVQVRLEQVQDFLWDIKGDVEEVLAIVKQLKEMADLSDRIKPRDELTHYTSNNLELIGKAMQLSENLLTSDPQYSQAVIGLGSVVSSQGNFKQAEALFSQAHQQAKESKNNEEQALSAFNLFQLFTRQNSYDEALAYLQEAIKINQKDYALFSVINYDIQRILGAGGMGCVFLAQHKLQKKMVVIKCFWEMQHGSTDDPFKEAFLMAEIAGKYVPQPLDCGFVDLARQERGYFISEYIEGAVDGETWLTEQGPLDIPTGIAVALHIARGLRLAHEKGIFHLDLKPANLLLLRQDKRVMVKIIDFGLAKVAHSLGQEMAISRSHTGLSMLVQSAVFGTLDYSPPEQQGKIQCLPSAKSDMYALGKTLYRLLTGEAPQTFRPKNLADAPELFDTLCDCVEVDPDKRVGLEDFIKRLKELRFSKREWWRKLDDNWKKVFKTAIGIDGEPDNGDLEKIVDLEELNCSNSQISNLEPLCALTELQKVACWGNQISNLEPLSALQNLQELDCHSNQISSLEPLRYLLYMQDLDCRANRISDLSPLQTLADLRELDCGYNQIDNLKPLAALTKLKELDCQNNQITDLKPIQALTNLQELDCCSNQISDLEPLGTLVILQRLYFRSNRISSLEPLQTLSMLEELSCNDNQITSLEPCSSLTRLLKLHCGGNQISEEERARFK